MPTSAELINELIALGNPVKAAHAQGFFKTGPGEYGEGDKFLGIRVPDARQVAKRWRELAPREVLKLLRSPWHEARLVALFLLADQYKRGDDKRKVQIFKDYLANVRYVNNWDLVDSSAHLIVGPHLQERERKLLDKLVVSELLWERRIAVLATLHFIRQDDFADILRLAKKLLRDEHDLMHKAVGWMLREVEKRDRATAEAFLKQHYQQMPRTMLRYAIERLPEKQRQAYLLGKM
jgi:3-methyladenine DNA glycosylase AlkD